MTSSKSSLCWNYRGWHWHWVSQWLLHDLSPVRKRFSVTSHEDWKQNEWTNEKERCTHGMVIDDWPVVSIWIRLCDRSRLHPLQIFVQLAAVPPRFARAGARLQCGEREKRVFKFWQGGSEGDLVSLSLCDALLQNRLEVILIPNCAVLWILQVKKRKNEAFVKDL